MSVFNVLADDGTILKESCQSLQEALDAGQSSRQAGEVTWFSVIEIAIHSGYGAGAALTGEVPHQVFDSRSTELQ